MLALMKSYPTQDRSDLFFCDRNHPLTDPAARHYERLAFVEHVCGVLIESRSGRPPVTPWDIFEGPVEDIFDRTPVSDLMPEWAFDLMPKGGFIPRFVLGRAGFVLGRSDFVPGFASSIAPGFSPGSGHPTNSRSRLDAGDNVFGTRGYFNNHGPPCDPAALFGTRPFGLKPVSFSRPHRRLKSKAIERTESLGRTYG